MARQHFFTHQQLCNFPSIATPSPNKCDRSDQSNIRIVSGIVSNFLPMRRLRRLPLGLYRPDIRECELLSNPIIY